MADQDGLGERTKVRRTKEAIELEAKRDGLELSRRRVLNELQTCRSEVQRSALENALNFLDEQLRDLNLDLNLPLNKG